jgi:hypothetical protein
MESFIEKFPKVDQGQLLSDEQLNAVEGGACETSCKQACQPGNMNGTVGQDTTAKEVVKAVAEIAKEAL